MRRNEQNERNERKLFVSASGRFRHAVAPFDELKQKWIDLDTLGGRTGVLWIGFPSQVRRKQYQTLPAFVHRTIGVLLSGTICVQKSLGKCPD